ncbi:hypothetical protein [Oceanicoccus sp. KOV_DT_Chl]|uniref:hypothetical protein n=1 Tax=Oceanicoccus sp. KOV_DT_Chl TaxID=1904639 RepID=UPI000C7970F5|nr:hypothetical protein [Oceanicoccus sp. KOV_DT_Chl]
MADLSYLPFFTRYSAVAYFRHFELPATSEFSRVRRWRDACCDHPLRFIADDARATCD